MGSGLPDVWWFRPDGRRMTQRDWQQTDAHTLGVFLNGQEIPERTTEGRPIGDDSFLLLFNAHYEPVDVPAAGAALRAPLGARALDGRRAARRARRWRPRRRRRGRRIGRSSSLRRAF